MTLGSVLSKKKVLTNEDLEFLAKKYQEKDLEDAVSFFLIHFLEVSPVKRKQLFRHLVYFVL